MKVIVVGSFYNKYLHDICINLYRKGISVDDVLIGSKVQKVLFKIPSVKRVFKRHGVFEIFRRFYLKNNQKIRIKYRSLRDLQLLIGFKLAYFDSVNSGKVLSLLSKNKKSQVVILAGTGLVDKAFLLCAGEYCINGHPAWLPGYRGVDVVDWALSDGSDVGVTSHLVISKVDAGKILVRKKVPILKDEPYSFFRERVNEQQARVVSEGVIKIKDNQLNDLIKNDLSVSMMCFVAPTKVQKQAIQNYKEYQKQL